MNPLRLGLVSLLTCLLVVLSPVTASTGQQTSPTIITMTVPESLSSIYRNSVIPAFEAENPDIQVEFVFTEQNYYDEPLMLDAEGRAEYFEKLNTYANSADVLFVDNFFLNPYTTATGFFLDLAPLVNADNTLHAQDFYPVAWQAFQWEGGMWALPYAFNLQLLNYHKGLFDEAGLDYPNEDWEIGDFIHAAETLQVINEQGEIDFSPLMPLNPALLVLSMIGNYYDDSTIPNQPDFTHPALAEMFALLLDYYQSYQFKPVTSYLLNSVPLNLSFPYQLSRSENNVMGINHEDWVVTLPPGGRAFTQSQGFAISRGTSNPEAAYRFLKFLTGNPDVVASASGTYSAQRNLPDIESSYPVMTFVFSPEVEAFLAEAVENAIPASEARFALAFSLVRNEVESTGVDVATAIDSLQERALSLLIEAQSYQSDRVVVASPQTRRERDADKITLNFGLNSMGVNMVRSEWEEVVDGFVANHPTVTHINIHESMYGAGGLDTSLDCYYDGFSQLAFAQTPLTAFIALDPLIDADPNFDPADFWAGILEQAQVGGGTYGYPIIIQPITLSVNPDKFREAGLSVPQVTWTAYEFGNAIEAFKDLRHSADDFIITNYLDSSSIMMMLIASYGGQLVDYQTLPFAYQLTSPQTLNALEQLSQFVHDGVMAYISPINPTGGSYLVHGERFIMIESGNNIRLSTSRSNAIIPMQPVMFPSDDYIPVSYQAGMAYINSESRHIEACYDWITTLAKHAELFSGMPVRRSHLDDPKLTAIYGTDMIDFYAVFGESLNAPNAIHFPSQQGIITTEYEAYVEFTLVYFALDNIMLHDAEVVPEMEQAENNIAMYRQCTSEINVLSTDELNLLVEQGTNSRLRYDLQYVDCLVGVVPELRPSFSYLYDIIAGS